MGLDRAAILKTGSLDPTISLESDFGINGLDRIAIGTPGGGLDILGVSFCMCIAFYACWWLLLLDDARITIT